MRNRFLRLYNLLMEDIDTQRKPIQKVDAMSPKEFIAFLKEFLPYVKNGAVDLNDIRVSEKVDGQALRLLTQNGEMLFESSYSGVTTWDKVPMKEAAEFLYKNYSQLFHDIYDQIGSDFKLIGELIWIDEMEESGKVTPVGASYLTNKFGNHGGMVVFDIMKIENNELVPFDASKKNSNEFDEIDDGSRISKIDFLKIMADVEKNSKVTKFENGEEHEIFNMIRDLNNEDFSFYLIESIDITKRVKFTLDAESILDLISKPEYNKEKFDRKKDAAIIEEIKAIQADVCSQLSQIVDNTQGAFSDEGDLIEGIVVKIKSSGNQYGMFSDKYRETKHVYWESFEKVNDVYDEFFRSVFKCLPMSKKKILLPKLAQDREQFRADFEELQPVYKQKVDEAYKVLEEDNRIPKAAKRVQLSMGKRPVERLAINDYEEFIKKYITYEG